VNHRMYEVLADLPARISQHLAQLYLSATRIWCKCIHS
jgi:hypothetical protein